MKILGKKFNDEVAAKEKRQLVYWVATTINERRKRTQQLFDIVVTDRLFQLYYDDKYDKKDIYKYLREKADGKMLPIPSRDYSRAQDDNNIVNAESVIQEGILPNLSDNVLDCLRLLHVDGETHHVSPISGIDSALGIGKGDNMFIDVDERAYDRACSYIESLCREFNKCSGLLKDEGVAIDDSFLLHMYYMGAKGAFSKLVMDAVVMEDTPNTTMEIARHEVSKRLRPVYDFLVLLRRVEEEVLIGERCLTPLFFSLKDGVMEPQPDFRLELSAAMGIWTHNARQNEVFGKIDAFRKIRKSIEAEGLTVRQFDILTGTNTQDRRLWGLINSLK